MRDSEALYDIISRTVLNKELLYMFSCVNNGP